MSIEGRARQWRLSWRWNEQNSGEGTVLNPDLGAALHDAARRLYARCIVRPCG